MVLKLASAGSSVCSMHAFTFSKIFFCEIAWPVKAKFYMKCLEEGGTNVHINNLGHMTKMAAMPICGKNHSYFSFVQ